ncbi:RNA-directed DNA polymerase from mobile element jockey [Eumeta japonica]|uniref:RNA-directed DNA polymerase from mobile element jockey n=1 Tax=Eumeta variegata TaxID=151549 RepID=A0A4C1YE65_EUMVA|nr:RNA-directed DNA polymerase from mobile element jockey [Eumeta japonica]
MLLCVERANILHVRISPVRALSNVRLDNTYSSMRPIRAGAPQVSTLYPLLYSAYVNNTSLPSTGVLLALFADDIALYLRSNSIRNILPSLQRIIDALTRNGFAFGE